MSGSRPKRIATELLGALYWWTCITFWIAYFTEIVIHRSAPDEGALEVLNIWGGALLFHWHLAADPVLNFLLDAVLSVIALALVPGIFVVGFYIIATTIVLALLALITVGLLALAKASLTGTIVAAVVAIGIIYLAAHYARELGGPLRPVGSALFGVFGVLLAGTDFGECATSSSASDSSGGTSGWSPTRRKASPGGHLGAVGDALASILPETAKERAESHAREYGRGASDAEKAGIVDEFFHSLGDIIGTVTPSTSKHQSYEAGYHSKNKGHKKK
jgi:hypothetical protein